MSDGVGGRVYCLVNDTAAVVCATDPVIKYSTRLGLWKYCDVVG